MPSILDTFPFPFSDPAARELRKRLADLYPNAGRARRLLDDIGAETSSIYWEQPAVDLWHEILTEQGKAGRVRALVGQANEALNEVSPHKAFFRDLLAGATPVLSPEPKRADGAPVFIDGDDSVPKPEALLYLDDLTFSVGRVPRLVTTLQRLLALAPSVCRLDVFLVGSKQWGTAFRIAPDLLLTNWHVLHDRAGVRARVVTAEFGYEYDANDRGRPSTLIECDIESIVADKVDDWAVIRAVAPLSPDWPIVELRAAAAPILNEPAYIIQHPEGERKRIGFVRNQVTNITDRVVHYLTDTQEGSSGSPVFDGAGNLIALHHAGGRPQEVAGRAPLKKNEGIRIARVLDGLAERGVELP